MDDSLRKAKVSLSDVVCDREGVPTSIKIFSVGDNLDCRGVNAVYRVANAKKIMSSNTRADGLVPFDLGHGMLAGSDAPPASHEAHGWGRLRCDATGVWLDEIKWTDETRQKLVERKLRYISPAFTVHKEGKQDVIDDILTVSLTNIPATLDAQPIVRGSQLVCRSIAQFPTSTQRSTINREQAKTNMATKSTTEIVRRDEDDDEDTKPEPKDGDETVVRDDEDESGEAKAKPADDGGDKGDEDGEDDGAPDPSDVDIDSLNDAECRAFAARMVDMYMDAKASMKSRDESDKVKDDEMKRSIVKALHEDRLINYNDKKPLLALTLTEVTARDRKLRKMGPIVKAEVARTAKDEQREAPHGSAVARAVNSQVVPVMGATDEDIDQFTAHLPEDRRLALGLMARSQGAVYGTRIKSTESTTKDRN